MSRTEELLSILDNLTESWKLLGHQTQHHVQVEVMRELRANLSEQSKPTQQKGRR